MKNPTIKAEAYSKMPGGRALALADSMREYAKRMTDEADRIELETLHDVAVAEAPQRAASLVECIAQIRRRESL